MSSSKIQTYNLDPSNDIAKESSVTEIKTVSDEIKSLIGTEIATQLSTLKTDIISAISNNSSGGIKIKSFQKGTVATDVNSITISEVNVAKSICFFPNGTMNASVGYEVGGNYIPNVSSGGAVLIFKNSTTLYLNHSNDSASTYVDWAVIEFE